MPGGPVSGARHERKERFDNEQEALDSMVNLTKLFEKTHIHWAELPAG